MAGGGNEVTAAGCYLLVGCSGVPTNLYILIPVRIYGVGDIICYFSKLDESQPKAVQVRCIYPGVLC